ncbi:MAG: ABC transporter ATP-binding protein [Acidobacteria bacterium]|nr:ABC transporter ATP-binding protein [Acidobacteriota bacterium]
MEVAGLSKRYGDLVAVDEISFSVGYGEVVAILGPNGAGKSTTVEILEGFRSRDGGDVSVLGTDPANGDRTLRDRVGIVLQSSGFDVELTVAETIELYAASYRSPRGVDEVMEAVDIGAKANERIKTLSGGQQRRVDVALGLIGDPELLFLDEPTTGFDPAARRASWDMLSSLRASGTTIVLTTHYMDEADRLADRIIVLDKGRVIADATPETIIGPHSRDPVIRFAASGAPHGSLPETMADRATESDGFITLSTDDPTEDLHALTGWAIEHGVSFHDLELRRPSLEDVYLDLLDGDVKLDPT